MNMVDVIADKANMDIVWVGRSRNDPYWESCCEGFALTDFEDIYQPVAELLSGSDSRARVTVFVINISPFGKDVQDIISALINENLVDKVFAYSSAGEGLSLPDDFYVRSPEHLRAMLEASLPSQEEEESVEVEEMLKQVQHDNGGREQLQEKEQKEVSDKVEQFKTAKISKEELEALLGSGE